MTRLLQPLMLGLALAAPAAHASDAQQLAQAVRSFYDEGADAALEVLIPLHEASPERDDIAWWAARCELEQGLAQQAWDRLEGREGENIPAWRFAALRAWSALLRGEDDVARECAEHTIGSAPEQAEGEDLLLQTRWIAAGLAVRQGATDRAAAQLLALDQAEPPPFRLRAALPELERVMVAPLLVGRALEEPLVFQAEGRWWNLEPGMELATLRSAPAAEVPVCEGPDLCGDAGERLLPVPGLRWSGRAEGHWIYYAAGREPLDEQDPGPGLFRWAPDATVERMSSPAPGQQDLIPVPAPGDQLLFLRSGPEGVRLMRRGADGELVALAPELNAIHDLELNGEQVLLAALVDGAPRLLALPLDADTSLAAEPILALPLQVWALGSP